MTTREEIEARLAAASSGPWAVVSDHPAYAIGAGDQGYRVVQTPNQNNYCHYGPSQPWLGVHGEANAALIAHAPTDLRHLLDALAAAEAEVKRLQDTVILCEIERKAEIARHRQTISDNKEMAEKADRLEAADAENRRLRDVGIKAVGALSEALTLTSAFSGQPRPDTRLKWREVFYEARAALATEDGR